MFRWGILSTARIAHQHVIPAILDSSNGVLTAIASRDLSRAQALAARFGVGHAFGSYHELLQSDAVDGVYIPLPTSQHVEWTLKAAAAGKHVLCEKPISLDAADIVALIAARNRNKVLISEAFAVFYHPQWAKVRELLAAGAVGRLRHVQGAISYHNVNPADMRNQPALGGGAMADIAVYPMMVTRTATGREPLRVQATLVRDPKFGTDIYASIKCDFGDFDLSYYCGTQLARRQYMLFHGEAAFIELSAAFNAGVYEYPRVEVHNRVHDEAQVFRFPDARQFRLEVEAFARAAQGGDASVFPLESSALNQRAIDAVLRAATHDGWEPVAGH
jgi:predicted dehydrogenase